MPTALIADPNFSLDYARGKFRRFGLTVEAATPPLASKDAVALLTSSDYPLTIAELAALPRLKAIATASVGVDHLPLAEARERGIWVCNVPGFCTAEVADTT